MSIILTYFALAVRIFSNSFSNVFQKKLTNNGLNSYFVNFVTYFLLSVSCVIPVFVWGFHSSGVLFWKCAVVTGVLGALGNGFLIRALSCGELSLLGPINSYKAVFGLITAAVLLKEIPNLYTLLGVLLIVFGSWFLLSSESLKFSFSLFKRKDLMYRFLALIFTAAEAVFIKKLILLSDIFSAFVVWCVFGFVFSVFVLMINKINLKTEISAVKLKDVNLFLMLFVCTWLMQYTTNYVFNRMNVAYALSLFQLSALLSVVWGYKFFKEKNIIKKLLGAAVMVIGAVLIILFK